jgi:hypothetical protein
VTESDREQRRAARETTADGSRRLAVFTGRFSGATPLAIGIVAASLAGAVLLFATEFSTVASVDVASGSCEVIHDTDPALADRCELSGFERNGGAFLLVGAFTLAMGWGAGVGGSRPAAVALVAIGAAVLLWALLVDVPVTNETGALGESFEGAKGQAGTGLWLEIVAGVLAAGAGALRLLARPRATNRAAGRTSRR